VAGAGTSCDNTPMAVVNAVVLLAVFNALGPPQSRSRYQTSRAASTAAARSASSATFMPRSRSPSR